MPKRTEGKRLTKAEEDESVEGLLDKIERMDPVKAFALLVSKCASGLLLDLVEAGKSEKEARNFIVHCFLDFASGEACRIARSESREPDESKWRTATKEAFDRAIKRTALKTGASE